MELAQVNLQTKKKGNHEIEIGFDDTSRLSIINSSLIKKDLMTLVREPGTTLNLNMQGINFIDSSVFDALNHLSRVAKRNNSSVSLLNVEQPVLELIELVKKYWIFDIKCVIPAVNN